MSCVVLGGREEFKGHRRREEYDRREQTNLEVGGCDCWGFIIPSECVGQT